MILDGDNDRLFGIKGSAYLSSVAVAQPGACRATENEASIEETGEAERAAMTISAHKHEIEGDEHGTRGVLACERGMEREEIREAVLADDDGLAIDDGAAHLQSLTGLGRCSACGLPNCARAG